jgi:hypothetical protein
MVVALLERSGYTTTVAGGAGEAFLGQAFPIHGCAEGLSGLASQA